MSRQTATAGAVTQMAAQGLADAVLTGNPQVTFWRFVAKSYTNFALESQLLDYTAGQAFFGAFPKCNLDRIGDLVYWMYAVFDLPGIGAKVPSGIISAALTLPAVAIPFAGSYQVNQAGVSNGRVYMNADGTIAYVSETGFGYATGAATISVNSTSVAITIVAGAAIASGEYQPYWTDAVGQALIESANFFIGGQNIDYMRGEFLFIWEELTGQPGKHLREMTGNFGADVNTLQAVSAQPRRLYVPLPFWFTLNSGLALPLVSLQFHSVAVSLKLRPLNDLLKFTKTAMDAGKTISTNVFIRNAYDPNFVIGNSAVAIAQTTALGLGQNIQSQDLAGFVEVCYVYLDQRERSKFADGAFEQLMIEHQETSTQVDNAVAGSATGAAGAASLVPTAGAAIKKNFELNFNHTIIELFWAARLGAHESFNGANPTGVRSDFYNDWFNFAGPELPIFGQQPALYDPVDLIQLRLNNATRFGDVEGRYFRLVQPWQHHTNIPHVGTQAVVSVDLNNTATFASATSTAFIYSYSFALQPEDVQPSGSCNFSRIDNTQLNVTLNKHLFYGTSWNILPVVPVAGTDANGSVTFLVYATNWNILRFKYGLGGKRFAN